MGENREKRPIYQKAWQRSGYFDGLSKRISSIEEYWSKLLHLNWIPAICTTMYRLARSIHGSSAMFGYSDVADAAKALELLLLELDVGGVAPNQSQRDRVNTAILNLKREIHRHIDTHVTAADASGGAEQKGAEQLPLVYLLESDPSTGEYLSFQISRHGYQVRSFTDRRGLEHGYQARRPAVIVADVQFTPGMPEMEALVKLREGKRSIVPLIYIAERSDFKARRRALERGCEGYLRKPLDIAALVAKIDEATAPLRQEAQRVLLLHDDLAQVARYVRSLEPVGIQTHSLSKASKVIQEIEEFRPDLLIVSNSLVEMPVLELISLVRQEATYAGMPICVVSTTASEGQQLAVLEAGADDFLLEPVKPSLLVSLVWLRIRRAQRLDQRLRYLGTRDAVTGLHTRDFFLQRLGRVLMQPPVGENGLIYLQLDDFIEIRDGIGPDHADQVLAGVARLLYANVSVEDVIARVGDHTFTIVVNRPGWQQIQDTAERLRVAVGARSFEFGDRTVHLTASFGVALCAAEDAESLFEEVGHACITAAATGGNRIQSLRRVTDTQVIRHGRSYLDQLLDNAKAGRMQLYYQPMVSVHGDGLERYEALIRVVDEFGEVLPTRKLLEAATEVGLMDKIDRVVFRQALEAVKVGRDQGRNSTVFVKVSPASVRRIEEIARSGLEAFGLPGETLTLQFPTKVVWKMLDKLRDLPERLRVLGCTIGLEYYGESATDVQLLDRLNVDYVKMHPQLTRHLSEDDLQGERLRFLVEEARKRGVKVIVGFIEDAAMLTQAWQLDVDLLQGNFVQPPEESMTFDFNFSGFASLK